MIDYSLYLVTDEPSRYRGDFVEAVLLALTLGVTVVQYRDTESPAVVRRARAAALKAALDARGIPLVVNNDVELALALGAAGVHVGERDLPPERVREKVGPQMEIGFSVTNWDTLTLRQASLGAADAFGVGPVFDARKTKADAAAALGLAGFGDIAFELKRRYPNKPIIAIGGITFDNAAAVRAAGADSLAMVSAFRTNML